MTEIDWINFEQHIFMLARRVSYRDVANNIVPDNCSSTIAPALFYYLPSMAVCVVLITGVLP